MKVVYNILSVLLYIAVIILALMQLGAGFAVFEAYKVYGILFFLSSAVLISARLIMSFKKPLIATIASVVGSLLAVYTGFSIFNLNKGFLYEVFVRNHLTTLLVPLICVIMLLLFRAIKKQETGVVFEKTLKDQEIEELKDNHII